MTNDPIFSTNPDLEDVDNVRRLTITMTCDEDGSSTGSRRTLSDGRRLDEPIIRQEGETVRGMETTDCKVEQMFEAGQPEIIMEADFSEPRKQ